MKSRTCLWTASLAGLLALAGCGERPRLAEQTLTVMGEQATLYAPIGGEESLSMAAQVLRMHGDRIYPLIDIYSPDSEISRANRIATISRFPISRDTQHMLEYAQRLSLDLGGVFDITDATLRHLWIRHFRTEPDELLPTPLVHAARRGVGPHKVDVRDHSLLLLSNETQLDVNDFSRPYVIDLAMAHLRRQGTSNVLIDMGDYGRGLGRAAPHEAWRRPVPHPADANRPAGHVMLPDGAAFALFGLPHHYTTVAGEPVARIIDPRSGWPADGTATVLVVGPAAADTYGLAQALFILGREEGTELLKGMSRYQALFIEHEEPFTIWITPNLAPLFSPAEAYRDAVHLMEMPQNTIVD